MEFLDGTGGRAKQMNHDRMHILHDEGQFEKLC